jgi:DNA polymerase-4
VRRILHIDMDAFYASVEQRDDPTLAGLPVVVGGQPSQRGVVAAASYEARAFGVHSAMPMARAVRLCPDLVIVRPRFSRYSQISQTIFGLFRSVTPLVEPLSLDEAFLDVTENSWNEALGVEVARRLKREILQTTGLTASAGVAPNKFLAKLASGWKKPDGLTVIAPARAESFLQNLPVESLWGVGPVTARRLRSIGIETLTDVRLASPADLSTALGSSAETLRRLAFGIDDRPVQPQQERKSLGCETTFAKDLSDLSVVRGEVAKLALEAGAHLSRKALQARTLTLKVRYSNFQTITRSITAENPVRTAEEASAVAQALLERTQAGQRPIRLLGVSFSGLGDVSPATEDPQLRLPIR